MRRMFLGFTSCLFALVLTACDVDVTVVHNQTNFGVQVTLRQGDATEILLPSPGESSSAEMSSDGEIITGTVTPLQEWLDYATAKRAYLNGALANADSLTGPQLLDVVNQLKDIARRMEQYSKGGQSASASCRKPAEFTITTGEGGRLVVTCTSTGGK